MKTTFKILIPIFLVAGITFAQSDLEIVVGKVSPGEVAMSAFSLTEGAKISIYGTAASYGEFNDDAPTGFVGWIINSSTREVEWSLVESGEYEEDEGLFDFDDDIYLEKGDYEVYYGGAVNEWSGVSNIGDFWDRFFGRKRYKSSYRRDLYMTVRVPSRSAKVEDARQLADNYARDAIVSFMRVGDYKDYKKGFTVTADTRLRIYALGEGYRENTYDIAWIYDVQNNKRVWTLNARDAYYAGGGRKNIYYDRVITLPAGSYMVNYSSDDSHSFEEWNVIPPHDPQFWGITVWAETSSDLAHVKEFDETDIITPFVELNKARDDEYLSTGFTLEKGMDVRVLCLGEGGGYDMADYGWIINADTRETVWKMKKRYTEHAGGASKNRMIDETIHFDKGHYIAYYTTDDSHSYERWNSTPPIERDKWGLTLWTKNKDDKRYIEIFNPDSYKNENIIAEIVRVRDDRRIREPFELDRNTKVRIVALGEGTRNEMYDYGWIEDDRGRIVWEMTYRKTTNAGGASKNREFNDTILLEAGRYTLVYETDDSHSYDDWNASPPYNPELYGITLLLEK